jgi:hypothetical protein
MRRLGLLIAALLVLATGCLREPGSRAAQPSPSPPPSPPAATPEPSPSPSPTPLAAPVAGLTLRRVSAPAGEPFAATNGVYYVDPRTGAIEGWEFSDGVERIGWTVSRDGQAVVAGIPNRGGGPPRWQIGDTRSGVVRDLPDRPGPFSPDGRSYLLPQRDGVAVVRVVDGAVAQRFRFAAGQQSGWERAAEWSPDGRSVLFTTVTDSRRLEGRTVRLELDSGAVRELPTRLLTTVRWSPDGRAYTVGTRTGGGFTVYRTSDDAPLWEFSPAAYDLPVGLKGNEPYGYIEPPRWSPDGATVAVDVRGGADQPMYRVYVLDAATGAVRYLVDGAWACGPHVWSADGRWLLVGGVRGGRGGSFLVAAGGTEVRPLDRHVEDLSPVDADTAGVRGAVIDIPGGATRLALPVTGEYGWDFAHDPLWLTDGRMVLHAPHLGHGGCALGPPSPVDLTVRGP